MNLPIAPDIDAKEMQRIHDETMRVIGASVKRDNALLAELRNVPAPKEGERTCAICLSPVARDSYAMHMQRDHGYETLILSSKTDTSGSAHG